MYQKEQTETRLKLTAASWQVNHGKFNYIVDTVRKFCLQIVMMFNFH